MKASFYMDIIANYVVARNNRGFLKDIHRPCYGLGNVTRLFQRLILDLTGFQ